ncbi:hypothetical protein BDN71DRAFT_1588025 [Pleurotus eryngii]|uniref:Ubiquitin 3 binding protein But2 C-terminal domain-containing protein n=1 Tax=Pleurotus eryngii TaxID=5323 RepID=A0A9P6DHE4_PLEER|nr:hypothetical protein BDN71DRAFT_1588025 [Pleurotus eryngii]
MSSEHHISRGRASYSMRRSGRDAGYSKFTAFAVVLAILCTSINVHIFLTVEGPQPPMRFRDLGGLKRPNQFIGLERVRLPVVTPDPYKIYPNLLARVNKLEPKRAYSDDPKRFAALGKMVPPGDKQFKVTSQVSTIVEFRSVGYKMENCQLIVTVPVDPGAAIELGTGQNLVHIWHVLTNTPSWPIDPKSLTWDTRPTRVSKIGSITIIPGTNYTHSFSCLRDSLHVFEFAAGGEDVHVQWSQDHNHPNPAVTMAQRASTSVRIHVAFGFLTAFVGLWG